MSDNEIQFDLEERTFGFALRLLDSGGDANLSKERDSLVSESTELLCMFSAILQKSGGGR